MRLAIRVGMGMEKDFKSGKKEKEISEWQANQTKGSRAEWPKGLKSIDEGLRNCHDQG